MAGATKPKEKDPKKVTVYGRLSFPTFTAQAAYDLSQKGQYKAKSVAEAKPHFQLLLEPLQEKKLRDHIEQVFLPYCIQQEAAGEKRDTLSAQEVKDITAQLNKDDLTGVYNIPLKLINEKTTEMAPECTVNLKVLGNDGVDMDLKAIVNDEDELAVPDPDIIFSGKPKIMPLNVSVHSMYPGCYVAVTLNLYAYHNGKIPGFSAGASTPVFKADGERFGGGQAVDEDEIFAD